MPKTATDTTGEIIVRAQLTYTTMRWLLEANQHLMPLEKIAATTDSGEFVKSKAAAKIKYFIALSGVLLAIGTELKSDSPNIWYVLWAIFPYGAYYSAAWKAESISLGATIGGGILVLGVDIFIHIEIFFFPGSSTDSIALLTMPFWQSVVIMPVGFLMGWLVEKMINRFRHE